MKRIHGIYPLILVRKVFRPLIALVALVIVLSGQGRGVSLDLRDPAYSPGSPLMAWTDSVSTTLQDSRQSMNRLKEMLARETGEPVIEGTRWQRKKNPRVAMVCALAFPGLGQVYNEKPFKAVLAMGFEIYYLSRILHNYRMEKREEKIRDSYEKWVVIGGDEPVTVPNYPWREHDLWADEYCERKIDYIWWSAGCMLVIILDAYIDSHLHDMNFRIESTRVEGGKGFLLVIDF